VSRSIKPATQTRRQYITDPITLSKATSADHQLLWRRTAERTAASRERIILCRDIRRNTAGVTIDSQWMGGQAADAADWLEVALPERQTTDLNLINLLREFDPTYTRVPMGTTDTATTDADNLELYANSIGALWIDWDTITSLAVQDGEFAVLVVPDTSQMDQVPQYLEEDTEGEAAPSATYARDSRGRPTDHPDYSGQRSERQSAKAHDDELLDWQATHPPYTVRVVPATDCAPLLTRGKHSRWQCEGLMIRTLFDVEDLIQRGYNWEGMDDRLLIPRSYDSEATYGQCGQIYLYESYIMMESDTPGDQKLHPAIVYSVGGKETWYADSGPEKKAVVRDLHEEFGISEPVWGYFYGLHFDDDPEYRGMPYMWPMVAAITNLESLLTAHNCHVWANDFGGHVFMPDKDADPDSYIEGDASRQQYRTFTPPRIGEVKVMPPGLVVPFAQAEVGHGAPYLEGILGQSIRDTAPNPSATGGPGANSARQLVVQDALLKAGKQQIRQCVLDAGEFVMERVLMICTALMTLDPTLRLPVYASAERTLDDSGTKERTALILNERWVRRNYHLDASYPMKGSLAEIEQAATLAERGFGSDEDVYLMQGKESPQTERVKAAVYAYWRSPKGQAELAEAALRYRGQIEDAQKLKLQRMMQLTQDGVPMAALPIEIQQLLMAQQQQQAMQGQPQMGPPGAGAPASPTQLPDQAQSMLAGSIGGDMQTGPIMGEQQALAQVGGR
jgi:hypothetical protein